mmetsp:Transcript_22459/g.88898  ORF Transcript_22459/g.88898 Transcript_22459/m.88898 type:complete len:239 (-) Transcript_22459:258-974(-)
MPTVPSWASRASSPFSRVRKSFTCSLQTTCSTTRRCIVITIPNDPVERCWASSCAEKMAPHFVPQQATSPPLLVCRLPLSGEQNAATCASRSALHTKCSPALHSRPSASVRLPSSSGRSRQCVQRQHSRAAPQSLPSLSSPSCAASAKYGCAATSSAVGRCSGTKESMRASSVRMSSSGWLGTATASLLASNFAADGRRAGMPSARGKRASKITRPKEKTSLAVVGALSGLASSSGAR